MLKPERIIEETNKLVSSDWDKQIALKFRKLNLSQEVIGEIIGEIAEQRQNADREGYERGYNNGYHNATIKFNLTADEYDGADRDM